MNERTLFLIVSSCTHNGLGSNMFQTQDRMPHIDITVYPMVYDEE